MNKTQNLLFHSNQICSSVNHTSEIRIIPQLKWLQRRPLHSISGHQWQNTRRKRQRTQLRVSLAEKLPTPTHRHQNNRRPPPPQIHPARNKRKQTSCGPPARIPDRAETASEREQKGFANVL